MSNKRKPPLLPQSREGMGAMVYPFSEEEYKKGIAALENGKAAGIVQLFPLLRKMVAEL